MNVFVYLGLLVATACYALIRGGAPERIAAGITVTAVALSIYFISDRELAFSTRETAVLVVDIAMFLAILVLALFADRYWPLWMAAFLGVGLELHIVMWAAPQVHVWLYRVLHFWSSYPTLLLLFLGTLRHRQRLARSGVDPSWSGFSSRWSFRTPQVSRPG